MKKYNIQVTRVSLATPKFPHIHRKTEKGPGNHTGRYQKPGLKNLALHPLRDILFLLLYYLSFFLSIYHPLSNSNLCSFSLLCASRILCSEHYIKQVHYLKEKRENRTEEEEEEKRKERHLRTCTDTSYDDQDRDGFLLF